MDRYWMAVYDIFDLPALAAKRDFLYSFVDDERQVIEWAPLRDAIRPWSHGEQVLVRIAHCLYNDDERVGIDELEALAPDTRRIILNIIDRRYA